MVIHGWSGRGVAGVGQGWRSLSAPRAGAFPRATPAAFPAEGSALERYAAPLAGAEINSSFHRPHRRSTWERWAASVPDDFRFSVKLPKTITHQQQAGRLRGPARRASRGGGGARRQARRPPRPAAAEPGLRSSGGRTFFDALAQPSSAAIACEPRHPSWFEPEAEALLERHRVARVAADPARVPAAAVPGGWAGLVYYRLHGSPVIYRSSYDDARLDGYAAALASARPSRPGASSTTPPRPPRRAMRSPWSSGCSDRTRTTEPRRNEGL